MAELVGGDTTLSATALAVIGIGFIPPVVVVLVGGIGVSTVPLVEQLLVAVVGPMLLGVGVRAWRPERVGRYDDYYPSVSALMVVLIIGGVTVTNAAVIQSNRTVLFAVGAGVAALNLLGYGVGWLGTVHRPRNERIGAAFSVGMRDFAVTAALVVAAGLPPSASLPAVVFGIVEMVTSAGLARYFAR